jgi:hypothetical protein
MLSSNVLNVFGVVERVETELAGKIATHKTRMADECGFSKRADF